MKTVTISLKQLRTDPREYVRLLNSGHEVAITDHRRELARAARPNSAKRQRGNARAVLDAIRNLPPIKTPYPEMDTVELTKKTRTEGLEAKMRRIEKEHKEYLERRRDRS